MHDIRMSLFDLIEEHNRVGPASHRFGKLTAFFVAHIARRRTDQARRGEFLHVLGHVDLNQSVGVTKHELRNDPIGQRGSFRSARELRNALLVAVTASSWPISPEALPADVCSGSMFSRALPKSLPKTVLAPWRAVLTAGFPKVWANIPRLLVDPFVLDSRSFAPFRFRHDLGRRPPMPRAGRCFSMRWPTAR